MKLYLSLIAVLFHIIACSKACITNSDCSNNYICDPDDGQCHPGCTGKACDRANECPFGLESENGACIQPVYSEGGNYGNGIVLAGPESDNDDNSDGVLEGGTGGVNYGGGDTGDDIGGDDGDDSGGDDGGDGGGDDGGDSGGGDDGGDGGGDD